MSLPFGCCGFPFLLCALLFILFLPLHNLVVRHREYLTHYSVEFIKL